MMSNGFHLLFMLGSASRGENNGRTLTDVSFRATWKVAQLLVNEKTREKITILTSNKPRDQLLKFLDDECIPDFFGGKAVTTRVPKGGLIASLSSASSSASSSSKR